MRGWMRDGGSACLEGIAFVFVGSEVGAGEDDLVLEAGVVAVDVIAFCRCGQLAIHRWKATASICRRRKTYRRGFRH